MGIPAGTPTMWDSLLLLVVHIPGVDLLLVRGEVGDLEDPALATLGHLDFAIAHRLVAFHVGELQCALPVGLVGAEVHIRIAADWMGLSVELAGPLGMGGLARGVYAIGGDPDVA